MSEVKHPDVVVRLAGQDGNVFNLIGLVSKALRRAGLAAEVNTFQSEVMSSGSYDEALQCMMKWVTVK